MSEFIPQPFEDITQDLVNWLAPLYPAMDFTVGSVARNYLEAVAMKLEEHEVRTAQSESYAIQQSCYRAFGFERLSGKKATGSVVFTAYVAPTEDVPIPAGSRIMASNGQAFITTIGAILAAGQTTTGAVGVEAVLEGPLANVPAATITRMVTRISGIDLVTNPTPTLGGSDQESDDARASRFQSFIRTLPRGTKEALEYAALSVLPEGADARTIEPCLLDPRPTGVPYAGLAWLACDPLPDQSAVERVVNGYTDGNGKTVQGWKGAGVHVAVMSARIVYIRLRGVVTLTPAGLARWDEIQAILTQACKDFFLNVRIGDSVSYQRLSASLNTCDPDVVEVNMFLWKSTDAAPGYSEDPTAADPNPVDPADPFTLTSRCVLDQTTGYPEWVLA